MGQLDLLKTRRFWPLFWTQFFGSFNDNFLKNALVILIAFRGSQGGGLATWGIPPAEMVSVAGGVFILPFLLFSATSGQLADKHEKASLIRLVKLAEIAIMVLATAGFLTERADLLLVALFLMGLHSTFFGPLKYSILPQHLSEHELVAANAVIEAGTFLAILLGTIGGGALVAASAGTSYVSLILLGVALLGYWTSRKIPEAPAPDPKLRVRWSPLGPTWAILRDTAADRVVLLSVLGISWFWFFGASLLSLFPSFCKDVLGSSESVVSLFLGCFSVGIGAGSFLCERLSRGRIDLGLVSVGAIGTAVFSLELAFAALPENFHGALAPGFGILNFIGSLPGLRVVADLVLIALFSGLFIVPLYALLQERSEPSHRSRIIAANNVLNAVFIVASAGLLVLLLQAGLSIPRIFLVLACLSGVVALPLLGLLRLPRRRLAPAGNPTQTVSEKSYEKPNKE